MTLSISGITIGPLNNNVYFITDQSTKETIVVDPSYQAQVILDEAQKHGWKITQIWITHAHFDHIAGVDNLVKALGNSLKIGLHEDDLKLWQNGGGARDIGFFFECESEPNFFYQHEDILTFGGQSVHVLHTPGHSLGHVVFHIPDLKTVICGDLIFRGSIGRTDFPGGSMETILTSIRNEILNLPPETRLLSGHGPETTVAYETANNPFLK